LRQTVGRGAAIFPARCSATSVDQSSLLSSVFEPALALSDGAWTLLDSVTSTFFEKRVESSSVALVVE
jgi:hypothetical protein